MIVCEDHELNMRCRLVMNHAESVINDFSQTSKVPDHKMGMIGLNLRMTEFQAAVAREQLKKLDTNIAIRRQNVSFLDDALLDIMPIKQPSSRECCHHTFYVCAYLWDKTFSEGIDRHTYIEAVKAELTPREGRDSEGVQIGEGYITPIYKMPWRSKEEPIFLPVVEELWREELFLTLLHAPNSTMKDMSDVADAFHKVWEYREELR